MRRMDVLFMLLITLKCTYSNYLVIKRRDVFIPHISEIEHLLQDSFDQIVLREKGKI